MKLGSAIREMKTKAILGTLVALLMAIMLTPPLIIMNVSAGESPEVWAFLDRTNIYTCEEDSFSNSVVTGIYQLFFSIRPQGGAMVDNAWIKMESQYPENVLKPSIHLEPAANSNQISDDPCTIEWTFLDPLPTGGHAYVGLELYGMPVTFTPEFDYKRAVDPILITEQTAIQTVTIEFTPHIDFYNAHLYVTFEETPEASVSAVAGSWTPDWFLDMGDPNSVNWQGDPELGNTYIFSVELEVTNKLYPNPIFYKPHVGSGAFFNPITVDSSPGSITITDNVLDGEVTYSDIGSPGDTYDWVAKTQDENTVRFPRYSAPARARVIHQAEGKLERYADAWTSEIISGHWAMEIIGYEDIIEVEFFEAFYKELNVAEELEGTIDFFNLTLLHYGSVEIIDDVWIIRDADIQFDKLGWNITTAQAATYKLVFFDREIIKNKSTIIIDLPTTFFPDEATEQDWDIIGSVSSHSLLPIRQNPPPVAAASAILIGSGVSISISLLSSLTGVAQAIQEKISKLSMPNWLKKFLEFYSEETYEDLTTDEIKVLRDEMHHMRYLVSIFISAIVLLVVFVYVEVDGLPYFTYKNYLIAAIPRVVISVIFIFLVKQLFSFISLKVLRVLSEFKIWFYGLIALLITGLVFKVPFASPGRIMRQGKMNTAKVGLHSILGILMTLMLSTIFFCFNKLGLIMIGDSGLMMTAMTAFYSSLPIKPLEGEAIFRYNKMIWIITFSINFLIFIFSLFKIIPEFVYLIIGISSILLFTGIINDIRHRY